MSTWNAGGGGDGSSSSNSPRHRGSATVAEDVIGSPGRKRSREVGQGSAAAGGVAAGNAVFAVVNAPPPLPPAVLPPQQNTFCIVCGRQFSSRQALFGHMRLHGSRGWRGAFPPPVFNRDEFADVLPLLAPVAVAAAEVADAPPPPAVPDLNEPPQYHVPDLNFPPPPA